MLNDLPLQKISTVDATVNFIKKQIEEGALRPGEQLPSERHMQKLLKVSRFTLREALAKLSALGIVEITHGKGSFVTKEMRTASLGDVFLPLFMGTSATKTIDFFEARMIIESETVKLCAERRTKEDLKNLKEILDNSKAAMDDHERYGEFDFLFHQQISVVAKNVFIQKMMDCLNEHIKGYLSALAKNPKNRKRSQASHEHIFKHIKNGDRINAGRLMRYHLRRSFELIENLSKQKKRAITAGDLTGMDL